MDDEISQPQFEKPDTSQITNPEVKRSLDIWLNERNINREFYERIPEDKYDSHIVSDSPSTRDNLIYQIKVHYNYLKCMQEGQLIYGKHYSEAEEKTVGLSKSELVSFFDRIDKEIVAFVSDESNAKKIILVPWGSGNTELAGLVYGLHAHEIYHIGRNSVMLEFLNIDRFPNLKRNWG